MPIPITKISIADRPAQIINALDGFIDVTVNAQEYAAGFAAPGYVRLLKKPGWYEAYPSDVGGGLRGGDRLATGIRVEAGCSLYWLPPASTLCYPSYYQEGVVRLETRIQLAKTGFLYYAGKPLIPCRGSLLAQSVKIEAEQGAELFYWDVASAGRIASGEKWLFREFRNELQLEIDGQACLLERWMLSEGNIPAGSGGFQNCSLWATGLALGEKAGNMMHELTACFPEDVLWSRGEIADKVYLLRVLIPDGCPVPQLNIKYPLVKYR